MDVEARIGLSSWLRSVSCTMLKEALSVTLKNASMPTSSLSAATLTPSLYTLTKPQASQPSGRRLSDIPAKHLASMQAMPLYLVYVTAACLLQSMYWHL